MRGRGGEARRGSLADGSTLPPLRSAGGSCPLPKQSLFRGGSRDCTVLGPGPPLAEGSEGALSVSRSPLSGSSKAPFPPDRAYANDFQWTLHSRDLPPEVRPIIEDNKVSEGVGSMLEHGSGASGV
ncbi:hypothetical protein ABPG75_013523 [Micractinium tetrahymenae]